MDYTQLTDDELRRKVQELMGYRVYERIRNSEVVYDLSKHGVFNDIDFCFTEAEAWQQAPDYLNDANAWMQLVDEIGDVISMSRIGGTWRVEYDDIQLNRAFSPSIGRAICEVYCQVKEQK